MFHHHTTTFLPTLMACLPWIPTTPTPHKNHRTNPAHRPAAVQSVCASVPPLWQTSAPACPGRPASVPVATRSYRVNRLPHPLRHHVRAMQPYLRDNPLSTPPHDQDWPDTCACVSPALYRSLALPLLPPRIGLPHSVHAILPV